ncbi:MAG: SLC13 family permease [Saezia sp.]
MEIKKPLKDPKDQKEQITDSQGEVSPQKAIKGVIGVVVTAVVCYIIYQLLPIADAAAVAEAKAQGGVVLTEQAAKGLILLLFIGMLWLAEFVHITITALLVPVVAILLGVPETITTKSALTTFSDPIIFLFFGGFALATALHVQKLDRKIALFMMRLSKGHMGLTIVMLFGVTAALSMWVSNTATAAMMLPLALGVLGNLDAKKDRGTFLFVLLGIAYSASIGGLGTIVGSPPNAIASRALDYSFFDWLKVGIPMMLLLLPVMFAVLYVAFRPKLNHRVEVIREDIPWTSGRIVAAIIFICTAGAWIGGGWLSSLFGITAPDTYVALVCAVSIVLLGVASWKQIAANTDWGVLLLFGGGLALSGILGASGASKVLGEAVASVFGSSPKLVIIFVVLVFILILTEFTSNTASAALLVPVFATVSEAVGMPKEVLVLIIGLGASCAFMLPIATPPNAIVFGTGLIKQREMMKAGALLNVCCIVILTAYGYFLMSILQ